MNPAAQGPDFFSLLVYAAGVLFVVAFMLGVSYIAGAKHRFGMVVRDGIESGTRRW